MCVHLYPTFIHFLSKLLIFGYHFKNYFDTVHKLLIDSETALTRLHTSEFFVTVYEAVEAYILVYVFYLKDYV